MQGIKQMSLEQSNITDNVLFLNEYRNYNTIFNNKCTIVNLLTLERAEFSTKKIKFNFQNGESIINFEKKSTVDRLEKILLIKINEENLNIETERVRRKGSR